MKKILFAILLAVSVTACSGYKDIMQSDSNIKKVELDMTKDQVVKIMGKTYSRNGASKTQQGVYIETLRYEGRGDYWYVFIFENNKLVEWFTEYPHQYPPMPVVAPAANESK